MSFPKKPIMIFSLAIFGLLLAGCQSNNPAPRQTPVIPTNAATQEVVPAQPTATTAPTVASKRTLVVCLPSEPDTLYVYGGSSRSMWSVLEAIYDGPYDTRGYAVQPVILQKVPSLADGDAKVESVPVKSGDLVVDADGNLAALKEGIKVLPAGCSGPDCAKSWDGKSELSMDRLVVQFKMLPGLKWSDGTPLTAADSVFSYVLAADPATQTAKYLPDRTASYQAQDEQTVVWTGLPGFFEQRFGTFFWLPLPKHVLGNTGAKDIPASELAARKPVGWGPYMLQEWAAGDHITLVKNPNYFRAAEGLPKFDTLVYRFVGEAADGDLNALLSGECDVVDQNAQYLEMYPGLSQREAENKLKIYIGQGPEWEHLDFGIRPASYDDGYNPASGDRPDIFGDARTRQAFAYCIDRAAINANLLYNRSSVSNSFLPAQHPLYQADLPDYAYNPGEGQKLLDEVGWKDTDNDPNTPRVAVGVKNVPDGSVFSITYLTTQAQMRQQVAQSVASSLKACGIETKLQFANPGELFAPGPGGPVFGRAFDLAQFSWEASARPNCTLYDTAQIPAASNQWIGANITGYSSAEFDAACAAAYWGRPGEAGYTDANRKVQEIFANELPVIPLYSTLKIAIARPDLCGLEMDVTARSIFSNIEGLDYGQGCKK